MTTGASHLLDEHATRFARTSRSVLRHLSTTSGLATWMILRVEGESTRIIVAEGAIDSGGRSPQLAEVGSGQPHRVQSSITLADGTPFAMLVGFGSLPPHFAVDDAAAAAEVFAGILGALASTEMALLSLLRVEDLRTAATDPLTGLATRQGWDQRLRRDDRYCAEFGETAAVVMIELDELKRNNELYGHSVGDEQIRLAGTLMRDVIDGRHFAARVTGDRLGVVLLGADDHELGELERALRRAFSAAQLSTTVGVARREDALGFAGALTTAEAEMQRTIEARQTPPTTDASEAAALLGALERGEISAYFQPIVDLRTGEVVAVEALARWITSEGMREPDRFLRALQEAGLLGALFDHILDDGLRHLRDFRALVPDLSLAVNVEFDAATETTLLESVTRRLEAHGLPPSALSLELSERQTFELSADIRQDLNAVSDLGVRLMLDDFGTGFASLETLTTLPISGVKLDRKFTGQVIDGEREPVVVKAMIALAAEAGLTVIAEGIETQVQCDRLVRMGCRLGQGYLFALPQPAESVAAVLSAPLVTTF